MPSHRILIADHEPLIGSFVAGVLSQDGYETRLEQSSTVAIESAATFLPQLLVIDPIMPGLSGVEAAARISRETKCKVLFLTTLASDSDFREMLRGLRQQGCDCEALFKSSSKEQLLDHVRRRIGTSIIITDAGGSSSTEVGERQVPAPVLSGHTPSGYQQPAGDYEALLNLSTVRLYEMNAFRITGLNVDSSLRDIAREGEKLEMVIKLGAAHSPEGIFPLPEQVSILTIKSALQALKIPEQRLLHEFFWFWPCTGPSKDDLALHALRQKKYEAAVELWTKSQEQGNGIAVHNLAIYYHVRALDSVIQQSKARTDGRVENHYLWSKAFQYWKSLLERPCFWDSLVRRTHEINDPRLTTETVHRIWFSLPNALLGINAHLAIAAAEKADFEEAGRQRRLMYASGFGDEDAKKETVRALAPLQEEVERLCETAEAEARSNPKTANVVVRKFLASKSKLLHTFNYLLGVGDPVCDAVHDRIAEAGRACLIAYVNETGDWETARLISQECLAICEGKALRSTLEEDLEIIARNLPAGRQPQPSVPLRASTQRRGSTATGKSVRVLHAALIVLFAFVGLAALYDAVVEKRDSVPSSEPSSRQALPSSPSNPKAPESESVPVQRIAPTSTPSNDFLGGSSESEALKAQIESDKRLLNSMEGELEQSRAMLKDLEAQLESDKATMERIEGDQSLGLQVDVDQYERVRRHHNNTVKLYNAQVDEYNDRLSEYKQLLASTNAKIDRYNSLGRSR